MSFNVVRCEDVKPQPWKNGGGVTRELLAWPTPSDWLVRISVADIEKDGPFSAFPGVTRTTVVLSGEGIRLSEPVNVELRSTDSPYTFSGDLAPRCELVNGSTRDLNAMFNDHHGVGQLQRWRKAHETKPDWLSFDLNEQSPALFGVFTLTSAALRVRDAEWALPPLSLAWTTVLMRDITLLSAADAWAFHYTMHP